MTPQTPAFQGLLELVTILSILTSVGTLTFIGKEIIHWLLNRKKQPMNPVPIVTMDGTEYKDLVKQLISSQNALLVTQNTMATRQEDHFKVTEQIRSGVAEIGTIAELNRATMNDVKTILVKHDERRRRR